MQQKNTNTRTVLNMTSRVLSGLVILVSLMVLAGWLFDVAILKSLHPSFVSMKANTAISFLLLATACSFMLRQKEESETNRSNVNTRNIIPLTFAILVMAISTLTIIQYLFDLNFGLDELFFSDAPHALATFAPGRMALHTAIGLFILSIVTLLYTRKNGSFTLTAQLLSLFVLLLSIMPIFGYLYQVENLIGYSNYTQMALHTGALFFSLSLSLLLMHGDNGLLDIFSSPGTGGYFARRLLPAAVITPVFLMWIRIIIDNSKTPFLPTDLSYFFVIMIIIFVWFVWRIAGSLNKLDRQREQAEETSRNWTDLMQYIIKYDPNAIAVFDKHLRFIYVSDRFLSDYKLENKDIIGKHHYEVFPDIPEKWKMVHERALQGEVLRSDEDIFERADGSVDYTSWECRPWHKADGAINGIIIYTEVLTPLKTTEKQLRNISNRLKLILENAGDGIFAVDTEGKAILVNKKALDLLGYEEHELIGKTMHPVHHHSRGEESSYPIEECAIYRAYIDGEVQTIDNEVFWRKDGSSFPVEYVSTPIVEDGDITGAVVNFRDITTRKKAEEEIRKKNEFIQTVLDHLPIGVALNTFNEGEATYMNKKFEEIYGWDSDTLKNIQVFFEKVYPDPAYRKEITDRIMSDIQSGDPKRMHWEDIRITTSDQSERFINALNIPLIEQNTMVSTVLDITKFKLSENEIIALNNLLFQLIATINDLSTAQNREEVQIIVARAAKKLTNAQGATFVYRDGDDCYYADEDTDEPLWKGRRFKLTECITGWAMLNNQSAIIPDIKSDARIPQDVYTPTFVKSLAVIPVNTKNPIAAIGNYWDHHYTPTDMQINLLKALADAAAISLENIDLVESLEQKVKNRTQQLEATNKELEAFTYSVSHDLRAPLRAIDGFTRILQEDHEAALGKEGIRLSRIIRENTQRMGQLIDDLLTFSRLSRKEIDGSEIDMQTLANSIYFELTNENDRKRISFRLDTLPRAHGDPTMIRQVWVNLLSNALKFTANKKNPEITIVASATPDFITYRITDNGVGFDMRYVDKIFGVFQRLHSARDFEGTGVGLAIVQRVITRHGGTVSADSKMDEYATFSFSLPRKAS